jgi:Xaa-Pro aminopeptidase
MIRRLEIVDCCAPRNICSRVENRLISLRKDTYRNEFDERVKKAEMIMGEKSLGALIVSSPADVRYLSNYNLIESGMGAMVVVPAGHEAILLIDQEWDLRRAKEVSSIPDTRATTTPPADHGPGFWLSAFVTDLPAILKSTNVKGKVGVVGWSTFPTPVYLSIKSMMPEVQFEDATAPMLELRMIKSPAEVELLVKAAKISDEGAKAATNAIRHGKTEVEIAVAAEVAMKAAGADSELSFGTVIGSGNRSILMVPQPTEKKLELGDLVLMDLGGRCGGYCGDISRTKQCGTLGQKQKDLFEVVSQMHKATIDRVRPGVKACELNEIAKRVARESGYEKSYLHGVGHGCGLDEHERPWLETEETELVAGMVHTIEPGLYVPGVGGVRIEDMVLVTDTGRKVLTSFDRDP